MSEPFDPDEYLKGQEAFDPDAYLADAAPPVPAETAPVPEPSAWGSAINTARGAVASVLQGPAMQWADEAAGLLGERDAALRYMVEGGQKPNLEQEYRDGREAFRNVENSFRAEHPAIAFALTTGSGALLGSPVGVKGGRPFTGAVSKYLPSPSELVTYIPALVEGGISGAGAALESEDMPQAAAIGAPFGVGGQAFGEAAGQAGGAAARWVSGKAGQRVAAAEGKATQMAADKVAAEIASAKGKLGATTQEANRAVENLLRLEGTGALTGEQAATLAALRESGVLPALERKLASSMLEQVPGAAGRVDAAKAALGEIVEAAPEATDEAAQAILSGSEAKRQIMERVKRYAPTLAGASMGAGPGGIMGYILSSGSPEGALAGALAGAGARPAFRAVERMARHPAVQSAAFRPVRAGADAATAVIEGWLPAVGGSASRALRGEAEAEKPRLGTTSETVEDLATNTPEALGPYAQQVQQAVTDGNLPLVHYVLQQKDPQYRALLEQARTGAAQ